MGLQSDTHRQSVVASMSHFAFPLRNGNFDLLGEDLINKDEKEKDKYNNDIITVMDSEEENVEDDTYDDDVILAMGPWWGLWLGDEQPQQPMWFGRPQRDAAESPSSQPIVIQGLGSALFW